jgi:hypothetical protein
VLHGDFDAAAAAGVVSADPEESEPSEESVAIDPDAESLALALALANGTSPGPVEFVSPLLVERLAVGGAPRALMLWNVPDMSLYAYEVAGL